MNESTVRAERFEVQGSSSPLYVWEVTQKPVSVEIPFGLIDRLEREAVENFRSLTSRGSEIGGMLIGSVRPGNPATVSIADYELIECDYTRGPLYRLSEADLVRLEQAREKRLAGGAGIAGYFRSHTRKGMSLDSDDLSLFQARFRDANQIALLVRPFATKASTAGIFIWENGKVNGDSSYLEFPFRSSELGTGKIVEPGEARSGAAAAPKAPARAQIVPIASRREISIPAVTAAETATPIALAPPVVAAPPAAPAAAVVAAAVVSPVPVVEAAAPAVEEKPARIEKPEKPAKADKASKAEKIEKAERAEKLEKAQKAEREEKALAVEVLTEPVPVPSSGKGMKLILAAAAMLALIVGLFVYPGVLRHPTKVTTVTAPQDTSPLQLRVERTAGELLLSWNRDSEAIRNASKAVLSITDGDQHENVDMDLAQLRNGSVVYSPTGADISFKMEVSDKTANKTTSESVRVLRTRPSPLTDQNDAQAAAKAAAAGAATAAVKPGTPGAGEETAAPEPVSKPVTPVKAFQATSLGERLRAPAPSDMPDAPSVGGAPNPGSLPGMDFKAVAPAPVAPAAPAATVPGKGTDAKAPAKSGGQIQQAQLIYRKDAEYPKIAKQTGARGVVTLKAMIGKDGLIKSVKVVSGHPMLTNAAVEAVKQWRYRPTLLNGQPVETETEVLINFVGDR